MEIFVPFIGQVHRFPVYKLAGDGAETQRGIPNFRGKYF